MGSSFSRLVQSFLQGEGSGRMPPDSLAHSQRRPINSWSNGDQTVPKPSLPSTTQDVYFPYPGSSEHPWSSVLRPDLLAVSPWTDLNDGTPHRPEHRFHSLPSRSINFSSVSVQSNLFTHSWHRPSSMALTDLASYIDASPTARVILLKWCKDLKGVPHEFLVLNVQLQSPDRRTLWLRLDRRSHRDATTSQLISSTSASADTATVCETEDTLFDSSRHRIEVQTTFTSPPALETLRDLLFILMEESPNYKLMPENCIFFCSVIYENLVALGGGMSVGVPRRFSMSLAPTVRAKIKSRSRTLPS